MEDNQNRAAPKRSWSFSNLTGSRPSRVYIVEYIVLHLALLGIISTGTALFNKLLDETADTSGGFDIYSLVGVEYTLLLVASGLVATLLFVILSARTGRSEDKAPQLLESRRRRFVPYVFLSITAIAFVGYVISLFYTLLVEFFGADTGGEDLWRVLLKQVFALLLIGAVSLYAVKKMENRSNGGGNEQ